MCYPEHCVGSTSGMTSGSKPELPREPHLMNQRAACASQAPAFVPASVPVPAPAHLPRHTQDEKVGEEANPQLTQRQASHRFYKT